MPRKKAATSSAANRDDQPGTSRNQTGNEEPKRKKSTKSNENMVPKKKLKGMNSKDDVEKKKVLIENGSSSTYRQKIDVNVVRYNVQRQKGIIPNYSSYSFKSCIINKIKQYEVYKTASPFTNRVTFLVWHPTYPRLLSVACKSGDVILWDYEKKIDSAQRIQAALGSIQDLKFDPTDPSYMYAATVDGKCMQLNVERGEKIVEYLSTGTQLKWYCCFDRSIDKTMVVGDTEGVLTMLDPSGKKIKTLQIHSSHKKITSAEFSKKDPYLLCTASNDSTTKLWDLRSIRENQGALKPLKVLEGSSIVSSAHFSLTDGCRLLTTELRDNIRVYRSPLWQLETDILHPHRSHQHLTALRAYWHPLEDIAFIGRNPGNDTEPRSIDFFDAETGSLLHQHSQVNFNHVKSLNRFNHNGDVLASSVGFGFLIWKPNYKKKDFEEKKWDDRKGRKGKGGKEDDDDDDNDGGFWPRTMNVTGEGNSCIKDCVSRAHKTTKKGK